MIQGSIIRNKGKILKWNDDKGFGFILPEENKQTVFVHIKAFNDRTLRPSEGQSVTYTLQEKSDGKYAAISVSRPTDNIARDKKKSQKYKKHIHEEAESSNSIPIISILFIIGFTIFLLQNSLLENRLPPYTIFVYIVMGAITYFTYAEDKSRALKNEYRISEKSLLMLSLFGGWMGALIAQNKFKHKRKKITFQMPFWIVISLNIFFVISKFQT